MNLYIESLEGGNYLVATGNDENKTLLRDSHERPVMFHCLTEIKSYFGDSTFDKVWLTQTTPYEEMIGQSNTEGPLELEIDWH
ncbi:DUF6482 family protein [Alteromonas halophila]|nr:DUF6482 family protein [Alteromonas halophila]